MCSVKMRLPAHYTKRSYLLMRARKRLLVCFLPQKPPTSQYVRARPTPSVARPHAAAPMPTTHTRGMKATSVAATGKKDACNVQTRNTR